MVDYVTEKETGIAGVPDYTCTEFSDKRKDVCVLIPVINEGGRILAELTRAFDAQIPAVADIILCDGGSTDGSME
ncbi:MAG: glycosyltransferase family 2 protein, partial [Ruthenibacterium sp.]